MLFQNHPVYLINDHKTFAFSAENPTGTRAGGSRGGDCTKLRPCITIQPGETVTLADTDGPGMIQSIWFTGYVGHSFILRIYWDNQEYPLCGSAHFRLFLQRLRRKL